MNSDIADQTKAAARQAADLKRMRLLATALLGAMGCLFLATSVFHSAAAWLGYPRAFAEAAVVGAFADWFAVVALFRHPFGIPIPHTAIIPRQKERIAEAIGRFVAGNLLDLKEVTPRIENLDAADWLAARLKDPEQADAIGDRWNEISPALLGLLKDEQLQTFIRGLIAQGVEGIELAPILARGLSVSLAQNHYDAAFNTVVDAFRAFLVKHQDSIRKQVAKSSVGWIPGWVDSRLADAILADLISKLGAARDQTVHPWRSEGRRAVQRLIVRLADDEALAGQCGAFKAELLNQPFIDSAVKWAAAALSERLGSTLEAGEGATTTSNGVRDAMQVVGRRLQTDVATREILNDWVRRLIVKAVVGSRWEAGRFVTNVIAHWNTPTLVERLELQVGKDLQYIRVNGTLVGGSVGLIIYTVTRLFS